MLILNKFNIYIYYNMSVSKYLSIFILALIIVLAMRGDLSYFFPVFSNYIRNIQFYLGTAYNQFYGYLPPVNPDPSVQSSL